MGNPTLQEWLAEPRSALVRAIADGIHAHVDALRSQGAEFYGYALLPGEPYDIRSLIAVANTEADIDVPPDDDQYRYYRYCADEWAHWEHGGFKKANELLADANERFKSMHSKAEDDFMMDEFEIAHANALLDSIVLGLQTAKAEGVFAKREPFLVVWIADSGHKIMIESAQRLNSASVAADFIEEFA